MCPARAAEMREAEEMSPDRTASVTTTITATTDIATLINVFSVSPDNQQRLVDLLVSATETVMRHRPGFVSANIHASDDGTKVVNYAQWATKDDFHAMLADPQARHHMAECAALAEQFDPHVYRVASVHHA